MLLQQIINGAVLGSIYALVALGYTLVYGILKLINFAHSEIFMMGAFFGLIALQLLGGIPFFAHAPALLILAAMVISMAITGLLGVALELVAYRPLRNAPRLAPLISALGMSIFLQNLMMFAAGAQSREFPKVFKVHIFHMTHVV